CEFYESVLRRALPSSDRRRRRIRTARFRDGAYVAETDLLRVTIILGFRLLQPTLALKPSADGCASSRRGGARSRLRAAVPPRRRRRARRRRSPRANDRVGDLWSRPFPLRAW